MRYYASVEERDNPALVGQPVIVGGTAEGRGIVAAANYEARKYGVHSAMAAAKALRLCPHAVVIKPRMDYYVKISREIRAIFERFTPVIEPLSLDEAFLDTTGSESLFGSSLEIGRQIKEQIRSEVQLVASVGVAPEQIHRQDRQQRAETGPRVLILRAGQRMLKRFRLADQNESGPVSRMSKRFVAIG